MTQENKRRRAFRVGGRWQTALSLTGAIFYYLGPLPIEYNYWVDFCKYLWVDEFAFYWDRKFW